MFILTDSRVSGKQTKALMCLGYAVIRLPSFRGLYSPVSSHPDMLTAKLKDGSLLITEEYYNSEKSFFDSLGARLTLTDERLSPEYPNDVLFDALSVNGTVFGKKGCVSKHILYDCNLFVPVNQGYARCSVAMLSDACAVTADVGLCTALSEHGINTLLIRSGHIVLEGYDTGFIGGAGGRLPDGQYVFFGDILSHPDGKMILDFAHENKISAVSLSDEPLSDHGGIVAI